MSAGCPDLALEEGSCQQVPGSGISGVVQGALVTLGSADFVRSQLRSSEQGAADRFMEASTSQTSDSMQVRLSQRPKTNREPRAVMLVRQMPNSYANLDLLNRNFLTKKYSFRTAYVEQL
jgi:cation transport ATPase